MCDFEDPAACNYVVTYDTAQFQFKQQQASDLSQNNNYFAPTADHTDGSAVGKFMSAEAKNVNGQKTK